jgi:ferredoxin-NADP reductase
MAALKLVNKENLVDNVWAFRFEPSEPMHWTAGQYMRVELPHENPDAEGTKRYFTVSSAPYEHIAQITTRVTGTTFKTALAALPIGAEMPLLAMPEGDFIWEGSDKPLIFVAGGIGITPFYSILKQRVNDHQPINVTLVYGNRTDQIPFQPEFDQWHAVNPQFKVQYVIGEPLTGKKLAELNPDLNKAEVYVSGPEPMVEALGEQLKAAGLPDAQLKQDFFPNYTESNY